MNRWAFVEGHDTRNAISSCGKWAAVRTTSKLSLFSTTNATPLVNYGLGMFLYFSPSGEAFASVGRDGRILVFSVRSGELQGWLKAQRLRFLSTISHSHHYPTGKLW